VYWSDTPEGHHCNRHDYAFARGDVCHQCVTDPPPDVDGVEQDEREVSALRSRVNEYRVNSRSCLGESKRLRDEGTAQEGNLAVKWNDCALKWARLAEEQQTRLDEYTRDDRLIRREREMAGLRGSD
jgi:hypothetical protein